MYSDIYKREKKSTNRRLKKKDLLQPLGTVATVQNWKEKKKKWLTKMELQMNSEKRCMNSGKILQKKEHKLITGKK